MILRKVVTCTAPVNIAAIKYWGKRDEDLILPVNSSLSLTLNQDHLLTKTTIYSSDEFTHDKLVLNGNLEDVHGQRVQNVLRNMRHRAKQQALRTNDVSLQALASARIHIISENNFPTAAGLASSASGYACLVYALYKLFDLTDSLEDISTVARVGSGSACRSLFGGYVIWDMGHESDGSDSRAVPFASVQDWPDVHVLVLVVSDHRKDTSSTSGMQQSVQTSKFLSEYRAKNIVPDRLERMKHAIQHRDFETFGQITMQDSNQFHAVCLDTFPPIFYMNDVSRLIVNLVHRFNAFYGETRVAYTFDAGPNAVIFGLADNIADFARLAVRQFPAGLERTSKVEYFKDPFHIMNAQYSLSQLQKLQDAIGMQPTPYALQYILHTTVGEGPRILRKEDALPYV